MPRDETLLDFTEENHRLRRVSRGDAGRQFHFSVCIVAFLAIAILVTLIAESATLRKRPMSGPGRSVSLGQSLR
ncbi:hypothetical protein [Labrys sp. ZIDIC5]|jgi:hypothetical protein|uniref:hypothetical protein n=1 Tax=Labrys sedimenti TaxID=3106036 RepID=UPI002ACA5E70|nr:hypothetical protein [Labrys sp. ZIDIC5]MDZ5454181.1 hypothetical protein [Labrys sp. ZIDIC5]